MSGPLTVQQFSSAFQGELDATLKSGSLKRKFDEVDAKIQTVARSIRPSENASNNMQLLQSIHSLGTKIDNNCNNLQSALQNQITGLDQKVETLHSQNLQQFFEVEEKAGIREEKTVKAVEDLTSSIKEMTQTAMASLLKTNQLGEEIKSVKEELSNKIDTNQTAVMGVLAQIVSKLSS